MSTPRSNPCCFMPLWQVLSHSAMCAPSQCCFMQAIGVAIAFGVFKYGATDAYSKAIGAASADGGYWKYAGLAVIAYTVRFVNFFPMTFKEKVMKGALRDEIGKNMRSNPFIYTTVGSKTKEVVLFENDGLMCKYNRANRSLTHMIENFASVLAGLVLSGSVFPFPTFVCTCVFGVGRILHQVGYSSGYGNHGLGFMFAMLATLTMEGMCILVALAGLGLLPVETPPCELDSRIKALEAYVQAASEASA
jgi:hypothetical protein